jgi:hypothetical protein
MSKSSLARSLSAALVVFILASSASYGALIVPGGGISTPPSPPVVGAVVFPGVPVTFSSGNPNGFSGTLTSTVYQESPVDNPLGGLTFVYVLQNNANSATSIERFVADDFTGFLTDVSFAPTGTQAPSVTDRNSDVAGAIVGWDFIGQPLGLGRLSPGATSDELIVRTNAPSFDLSQVGGVIDGATLSVAVIGPAINMISPEPASLSLLLIGVIGLGRVRRIY